MNIYDAIQDDVEGIREIQKLGWMTTYPNKSYGISIKDIEEKFNLPEKELQEYYRKRKQSINNNPDVIHTWVAKKEKDIIGFCIASKEKEHRILAIYIHPEFQRKGIGKQLMKEALIWLGNRNNIFVNCAIYNHKAVGFYESFGFTKSGNNPKSEVPDLPSGKSIPEIELILRFNRIHKKG